MGCDQEFDFVQRQGSMKTIVESADQSFEDLPLRSQATQL